MNAVIYARFSSSGQQETSIEFQVRDCTEFAERKGYTVDKVFADRAKSATTANRPAFKEMISYVQMHKVNAVICWKRDRFARNRLDSAIYKDKLKELGIKVYYAQESNIESVDGIIIDSVMDGIAEWYSANLSANIRKGNAVGAAHRWTMGTQVFGLKAGDDKTFVINEDEAPIVKDIYEMYADGAKIKDIISKYPQFKRHQLDRMLSNEKYYGRYKMYGVDDMCIPPIISKELFDKVQEMKSHRKHHPNLKESDYILTGRLYCGECGEPMVACGSNHENKTYRYYCCVGKKKHSCTMARVSKEWAEMQVLNKLKEVIQQDDILEDIATKYVEWQATQVVDIKGLENEKRGLETKINHAYDIMIENGTNKAILQKVKEMQERINAIDEEIDGNLQFVFSKEDVVAYLKDLRICYDEKDWNKELVRTFLVKAIYSKDRFILQTRVTEDDLPVEDIATLEHLVDEMSQKMQFTYQGYTFFVIRKEVAGG